MEHEIRIDGIIGDYMNSAEDFSYRLAELNIQSGDELVVKINSQGGSVFDGFSIYNQLKGLENTVTTNIQGLAASIASLIALAGDRVIMSEVGTFMIHKAATMAAGNQEDLESAAEGLGQIDETLINVYVAKSGLPRSEIVEMMDKETWMSPQKARELNFVDELEETLQAVASLSNKSNITMNKLEALFTKLGIPTASGEPTTEPAATPAEPAATPAEPSASDDPPAEPAEPTEPAAEPSSEPEAITHENILALVVELKALREELAAQKAVVEKLNNGLGEFVDNRVKTLARGMKSNGMVPSAQSNFNPGEPEWTPKFPKHKEEMEAIEKKTRL